MVSDLSAEGQRPQTEVEPKGGIFWRGSVRLTVDAAGNAVAYDDGVYPAEGGNPCLSAMPYLLAEGMLMDGRSYNAGHADARYKFTSKERDTETGLDYPPNRMVVRLRSLIVPDFVGRTRRADVIL